MIRAIAPGLAGTWTSIISSYEGIDEYEARMLATRIAGDPQIDTMRVQTESDVEEVLSAAETVIEEVELAGALSTPEDEPALRDELLSTLRADIEQRMSDVPIDQPTVSAQPSRAGALGTVSSSADQSDEQHPANAAELYELVRESRLDVKDVEAVLTDLKDDENG